MAEQESISKAEVLSLTAEIVSSHVSNNPVAPADLNEMIQSVFDKLSDLADDSPEPEPAPTPKVSIKKSISDAAIICLDCGKPMKMLKRHLSSEHGLSIADYRTRWGLGAEYPMVAPAYARKRQALAKQIGLGRKPGTKVKAKAKAKGKGKGKAKK